MPALRTHRRTAVGGSTARRSCIPVQSAHDLESFIGLLAVDGTLLQANRMPLDLAHLSAQDALGRHVWRAAWWAWSPAAQGRIQEAIEQSAAGGVCCYRETLRVADGSLARFTFTLVPEYSRGTVISLVFSAVAD